MLGAKPAQTVQLRYTTSISEIRSEDSVSFIVLKGEEKDVLNIDLYYMSTGHVNRTRRPLGKLSLPLDRIRTEYREFILDCKECAVLTSTESYIAFKMHWLYS